MGMGPELGGSHVWPQSGCGGARFTFLKALLGSFQTRRCLSSLPRSPCKGCWHPWGWEMQGCCTRTVLSPRCAKARVLQCQGCWGPGWGHSEIQQGAAGEQTASPARPRDPGTSCVEDAGESSRMSHKAEEAELQNAALINKPKLGSKMGEEKE